MEKEQKFVETILKDAEIECESIKQKAQKDALSASKEKEKEEKEFFKAEKKKVENEFLRLLENEKDLASLEQNKEILNAKNEMLLEVFNLSLQKLKKLPAKEEEAFVKNVLTKFAGVQDGLIVSNKKGEKERVEKLAVFKKKKLKILSVSKEISGGVIIVSKTQEQDFSFEGLLKDKYNCLYNVIAKQLF